MPGPLVSELPQRCADIRRTDPCATVRPKTKLGHSRFQLRPLGVEAPRRMPRSREKRARALRDFLYKGSGIFADAPISKDAEIDDAA